MARIKVKKYVGVYYQLRKRLDKPGTEKVYYVRYKDSSGKVVEAKAGRQYRDNMTPARASQKRSDFIAGRELPPQEKRRAEQARKTVSDLWALFQEHKQGLRSFKDDECRFNLYLKKPFGKKTPAELVTLDLDRLRLRLLKAGKAPQTVKHCLVLLKRILRFGVAKGAIRAGDIADLHFEMPRLDNLKTEVLPPEQLTKLLKVLETDHDRDVCNMLKLALYTGMRRREIFNLRFDDVDFEGGFITIRSPKGGKTETIPLNQDAQAVLENRPVTESGYFFEAQKGPKGPRVDAHKEARRIMQKAGVPNEFRPFHGLRHVFASLLASSGQVDMYTLQKLLTHKSPGMTQRYAHLRDETLKQASNGIGAAVKGMTSQDKESKVVSLDEHKTEKGDA